MSYWTENQDKLGREEESKYIIKFLKQRVLERIDRRKTGSYVLNIDATWGEGKTFFMKGLFDDLQEAGHPVIMIDAWRDDFSDDPLTAVVAEFDQFLTKFKSSDRSVKAKVKAAGKELRRNVGKLSLLTAKGIAKRATTYVVGEAAEEIAETAKSIVSGKVEFDNIVDDATGEVIKIAEASIDKFAERKLAQFNEAKLSLNSFQTSLGKAVQVLTAKTYAPPFFILIDELDRCRPTYAIEMLERIKHLFEVENVVFVLGTDTTQLANSIKAVYGSEFDSRHYLARFFDRSYMLAASETSKLTAHLVKNARLTAQKLSTLETMDVVELITEISMQFGMELRQTEKAVDLLEIICSAWDDKRKIEVPIIFPMICAFLKGNPLSTHKDVMDTFVVRKSGNSDIPRFIKGYNLNKAMELLLQPYSVYEAANRSEAEMAAPHWGGKDLGEKLGHTMRVRERAMSEDVGERTVVGTYAGRVRMAGRFINN